MHNLRPLQIINKKSNPNLDKRGYNLEIAQLLTNDKNNQHALDRDMNTNIYDIYHDANINIQYIWCVLKNNHITKIQDH